MNQAAGSQKLYVECSLARVRKAPARPRETVTATIEELEAGAGSGKARIRLRAAALSVGATAAWAIRLLDGWGTSKAGLDNVRRFQWSCRPGPVKIR
jgi:hypothetical protein